MEDISSFKNLPHYPVMLDQVLELCSPENGGDFIDCTFGSGVIPMLFYLSLERGLYHLIEIAM